MTALRVSVAVPVHNGERHLGEALDSVLAQQPAPAQVVVVDDGSTDGTSAVLDRYAGSVVVLRQEASGVAVAMNRAVEAGDGDVVAFCDADDRWIPGRLALQLAELERRRELDIVGGMVQEFLSPEATHLAGVVRVTVGPQRARLMGALFVRRPVFDRVGAFDPSLRYRATMDWISRADAMGVRLDWIQETVMERRIHETNIGHDTAPAQADLLRVLRRDRRRRRTDEDAPTVRPEP